MIYLASPYSHADAAIREQRFREACRAAARLLLAGHAVYSPIVHGHPLVEHGMGAGWSSWAWNERELLVRCDEVVVLTLDGWRESVGVLAEIQIARELGKPVRYLAPEARAVSPTLAHVAGEAER